MSRPSFRLHLTTHDGGFRTATLVTAHPLPVLPPAVFGADEARLLADLAERTMAYLDEHPAALSALLFAESFELRSVRVPVSPLGRLGALALFGRRAIELRVRYAVAHRADGAYLVALPRFGWTFVAEDLEVAKEAIRSQIAAALLGAEGRSIFEFRDAPLEEVRAWDPFRVDPSAEAPEPGRAPELAAVADDWVDLARRGRLDPLVPRADSAPLRPGVVLLVGPPGAGKTARIRALAFEIAQRKSRPPFDRLRVHHTSGDRLVAGMSYLGMWQERVIRLVDLLSASQDVLAIDRLSSILRPMPGGSSIGELLRPALAARQLRLVTECTPEELARAEVTHPEIVGLFEVARVEEVARAEVPELMRAYQEKRRHRVTLSAAADRRALRHLAQYQPYRAEPGRSFRFLEWLNRDERAAVAELDPPATSRAFASYAGLPAELIMDEHTLTQGTIAGALQVGLIGQDEATLRVAEAIARLKAGLNDPDRPIGTFLFLGPTGVGKTELAKRLAAYLFGHEDKLIRLDMSELMIPGAAARLLAEGGASLAERVRRQPLSVVLFDELEKAHPEVFDLLLGILGEGRLTDELGQLVDFRMCVIVMTSNLGAAGGAPLGFGDRREADPADAVFAHFRPELVNRIDHIASFRSLGPADVAKIVDLELAKLDERTGLRRLGLTLEVTPAARRWLAAQGFRLDQGARPLKRLIEARLVAPLAQRLAEDPTRVGEVVRVGVAGEDAAIVLA